MYLFSSVILASIPLAELCVLPTWGAGSHSVSIVLRVVEEEGGWREEKDVDCAAWVEAVCSESWTLLKGLPVVASSNCAAASVCMWIWRSWLITTATWSWHVDVCSRSARYSVLVGQSVLYTCCIYVLLVIEHIAVKTQRSIPCSLQFCICWAFGSLCWEFWC